jgi:type VI secretion system protein ImpB
MSESLQHKLDRVRRPRVQITYDVETGGALERRELPFVVGVMADLSAQPKTALAPLKERKFVPVDRDTFNDVLAKAQPRIATRVENRLSDEEGELPVELSFENMDDFEPANVAKQIPALKNLLDLRSQLSQLLNKLEGNDKLEALLNEVLNDEEAAKTLASDLGVEPEGGDASGKK